MKTYLVDKEEKLLSADTLVLLISTSICAYAAKFVVYSHYILKDCAAMYSSLHQVYTLSTKTQGDILDPVIGTLSVSLSFLRSKN